MCSRGDEHGILQLSLLTHLDGVFAHNGNFASGRVFQISKFGNVSPAICENELQISMTFVHFQKPSLIIQFQKLSLHEFWTSFGRLNVRFFPDSITMSDSKAHKTSAFDSERVCCFRKARKNWIFMKQLVFSPNNSTSHPTLQLTQQWFLSFCRNSCSQIFSNLNNISEASHQCRSTWPFPSIVSLTSRLMCLLQFKANRFYFCRLENSWTTFNAKHVCRYWDLILSWKTSTNFP